MVEKRIRIVVVKTSFCLSETSVVLDQVDNAMLLVHDVVTTCCHPRIAIDVYMTIVLNVPITKQVDGMDVLLVPIKKYVLLIMIVLVKCVKVAFACRATIKSKIHMKLVSMAVDLFVVKDAATERHVRYLVIVLLVFVLERMEMKNVSLVTMNIETVMKRVGMVVVQLVPEDAIKMKDVKLDPIVLPVIVIWKLR